MTPGALMLLALGVPSGTVNKPVITHPADGAVDVAPNVTLQASAFSSSTGTETQASADWQIATDSAFTQIVHEVVASTTALTSWTPTP